MNFDEISKQDITLWTVATQQSTGSGQGFIKCKCKTRCKMKIVCVSKSK